ncbi:PAS domain-containing sensor histidine kinase [Porphyrobacter sp. AAP82]|uniref:PAS domain-containing sensor histidine kinase n=1 Tax=Porphyrobacter sp. AAP82 TaxID=1248917 RepID=UPI0003123706|nr:PAS domain-containing sensor histidine kinase [Porphyrobacter sp. AAP82]
MHYQDQEKLSHLIAQATSDAFVAVDPDNRVIYWNEGAANLFGWRADEIIGQSLHLIVPEIHRANHLLGMRRLTEGGQSRLLGKTTSVTALCRDGRLVPVELSLTHWEDSETGKPAGYAAIVRDSSERRNLEDQRDAYQRKLEDQFSAIEATSDGVAITDPEGFFTYLNRAHCTMFGYSDATALVGRHWSILYDRQEAQRIEQVAMPSVFKEGSWRGEACGVRRDGGIVEQDVTLAQSPSGGLVCTTRDIGEIKRATRDRIRARERLLLVKRKEMISRAVSGVAHDLANFIAVIGFSATTLRTKCRPCPPELKRIEGVAKQASSLLDSVLAPNTAKQPPRALDAKSALETVIELTAVTLKPNHSIRLKAQEDDIALKAVETEFLRVMINLCNNARDALPADGAGSIEVTLERLNPARRISKPMIGEKPELPSALITVRDTGCGIAEEELARIFEPFHTTKSYGMGLGLSVVSEMIAEAGGSINVKSGAHGTTFQLTWPLDTRPLSTATARTSAQSTNLRTQES